jgi:hypothetical protein
MKPLNNSEIALRIRAHLKRFASDPAISKGEDGRTLYWNAGATASGRWIYVQYIAYQGSRNLSKNDALKYLEWLDAGNVGRHYRVLEDIK